jgi:hypothetical protein
MGRALHCTACRLRSAYNRAVVDVVRDEAIGCLCTNCIATFFGKSLDRFEQDAGGCVLCDRDGFMALPKWEAVTVQVDGDVHIHGVDFDVTPETPRLCDHHLHDLCDERVRDDLPDPASGTS